MDSILHSHLLCFPEAEEYEGRGPTRPALQHPEAILETRITDVLQHADSWDAPLPKRPEGETFGHPDRSPAPPSWNRDSGVFEALLLPESAAPLVPDRLSAPSWASSQPRTRGHN